MKKIITILTVLSMVCSCTFKELCYDHSHVVDLNVVFNWEKAPGADPKSMSLYLFPKSGEHYLRYEFTDAEGGVVRVPVGDYDALCLNSDTENITYSMTGDAESFTITTRSADEETALNSFAMKSLPRASGTEQESLVLAPDFIWSGNAKDIRIRATDNPSTLVLFPEQSVCRYSVEIRDARNLQFALALSGSVSSLSAGWSPGPGSLSEDLVTIPFNIQSDRSRMLLNSSFLTFGHRPEFSDNHKLVVYAMLTDLSKWFYTFDVTDQIRSAPDPKNVKIIINGLSIPKPMVNGGGFKPSVDQWKSVVVEIKM